MIYYVIKSFHEYRLRRHVMNKLASAPVLIKQSRGRREMKTNWLLSKFALLPIIIFCALAVAAQDEPAKQNAQDQPIARPIPQRTVGLDPGKVVRWTLRDAIMAALDKNVDIELERENVRLQQYDLIGLRGFYDPVTTSTIQYNRSITPSSFR